MVDLPSLVGAVSKSEGVLNSLYSDLAAPGVKQVGAALETVLKTGNILLLPLRMLNEYAANFERKSFDEVAKRFSTIPEQDIVDVRPEIGAPILESLSTTHDPDLRGMFIELLANAADKNKVGIAHPSFVRVIETLSPDEAHILKTWKQHSLIPCLTIQRVAKDRSFITLRDVVLVPPTPIADASMIPVYVANLSGLGILTHRDDAWITVEHAYDQVVAIARKDFPEIKDGSIELSLSKSEEAKEGDVVYHKGYISLTPYGRVSQSACIP